MSGAPQIELPETPGHEHAISSRVLRRCGITSGQYFLDEYFHDPNPYVELLGCVVFYALMDAGVGIQWEADPPWMRIFIEVTNTRYELEPAPISAFGPIRDLHVGMVKYQRDSRDNSLAVRWQLKSGPKSSGFQNTRIRAQLTAEDRVDLAILPPENHNQSRSADDGSSRTSDRQT
jgi:hypothetical protein